MFTQSHIALVRAKGGAICDAQIESKDKNKGCHIVGAELVIAEPVGARWKEDWKA